MQKGDAVYLACDVMDCDLRCGYRGDVVVVERVVAKEPGDGMRRDYLVHHQSRLLDAFYVMASELTEVQP